MNALSFSVNQIVPVICAAAADELARSFNHHFDSLTIAGWNAATSLGADGLNLSAKEIDACAARAEEFFGVASQAVRRTSAPTFGEWAAELEHLIASGVKSFSFKAAARNSSNHLSQHDAEEILQDAKAAANLLSGRRRVGYLVAPHSLLGFELAILAPKILGVDSIDIRPLAPEQLAQNLKYGDAIVATPTQWRYLMREELAAADNSVAVCFGEAMSPELAAEMRKRGFGAVRELYGSTETGLIGWRDTPTAPFALFDHWRREGDGLLRVLRDGAVRSVTPMDAIEWVSEKRFNLRGRKDGAVQIGAVNVFPNDVAAHLSEHPKIVSCEISVSERSDGVSRLIAHIVLAPGALPNERTAREIDSWCRTNLRQQERPRILNFEAVT